VTEAHWKIIADVLGERLPIAVERLESYHDTIVMGDDFAFSNSPDGYRGALECKSAALGLKGAKEA